MSVAGAAIAAGGAILGTAGTAMAQAKLNKRTIKYNKEMWDAQNLYNLPSAQMERFKQAGLNPNLIYGQGNSGNAGAAPSWSPDAPDMSGIGGAVGKYFQTRVQQGQIERQKLENAVLATDLESKKIDVDVKKQLTHVMTPSDISVDENGQITYGTDFATKNMLYEREYANIQRDISRGDRELVASILDKKLANTRISAETQRYLSEAARTGLINAQHANTLSQKQLHDLDAVLRKYETEFLTNFDLKHGDVSRMLMQLIPVFLGGMMRR